MVPIRQLVLSLLPLSLWNKLEVPLQWFPGVGPGHHPPVYSSPSNEPTKSIAIVGAGSAGLAALKAILDLPADTRAGWEVILYEARRDVGGIWLGDPPGYEPHPPELPETPTYPSLHTNTPSITMIYPHCPFPEGTTFFPMWDAVQRYHADFAVQYDLTPYISFNHTVVSTEWHGNAVQGDWHVEVHAHHHDSDGEVVMKRTFDHLIVASGHNHYPFIPTWSGTDDWLANSPPGGPAREILHSVYYRYPDRYANRSVLIVGSGASAADIALQIGPLAQVVYQSIKEGKSATPGAAVIPKPPISHFTHDSVVFKDGSAVTDVDAVVLGTGYELRVPFLCAPHASAMRTDPATTANSTTATTLMSNLRYVFPLYRQIFNLAPNLPPTALAFVGLPTEVSNCPSDLAQGTFVAHTLANASLLPPRADMLQELVAREESLRARGYDPYRMGHKLVDGDTEDKDYQDDLINYLKKRGALPDDGKPYVEEWRRMQRPQWVLFYRGWRRILAAGEEAQWLEGVATEDEWVDLLYRIIESQRQWEKEHGEVALTPDFHVEIF